MYYILITIALLSIFLIYMCVKYGIPTSVSKTYYLLDNKSIFVLLLFACGFLSAPQLFITLAGSNFQFIGFLISCSILFIGASPAFKEGLDKKVHTISAIMLIVCSEIYVFIFNRWYIELLLFLLCLYPVMKNRNNIIFWIEIVVLYSLLFTILTNLII